MSRQVLKQNRRIVVLKDWTVILQDVQKTRWLDKQIYVVGQ